MGTESGNPEDRSRLDIHWPRWVAIVSPLAFLVAINYVGYFHLFSIIHSVAGFLVLTGVMAVAVFLLSQTALSKALPLPLTHRHEQR